MYIIARYIIFKSLLDIYNNAIDDYIALNLEELVEIIVKANRRILNREYYSIHHAKYDVRHVARELIDVIDKPCISIKKKRKQLHLEVRGECFTETKEYVEKRLNEMNKLMEMKGSIAGDVLRELRAHGFI